VGSGVQSVVALDEGGRTRGAAVIGFWPSATVAAAGAAEEGAGGGVSARAHVPLLVDTRGNVAFVTMESPTGGFAASLGVVRGLTSSAGGSRSIVDSIVVPCPRVAAGGRFASVSGMAPALSRDGARPALAVACLGGSILLVSGE
jgi:hypothetical protein